MSLGQTTRVGTWPAAKRTCKDRADVAAIDACFANFESCRTLPPALYEKYNRRTTAEARALPLCPYAQSLSFLWSGGAEQAAIEEVTPPSPAPAPTGFSRSSLVTAGILAAVVVGGAVGYGVYRKAKKKRAS